MVILNTGCNGKNTNILTENTIKKKGLKWSNISVKKYHQSPGLGVKSGRRRFIPQVFGTQFHPPDTKYERAARTDRYSMYSAAHTVILHILPRNGLGDASEDAGPVLRSIRVGGSSKIVGKERCVDNESASSVGDDRPE